MKGMRLTKEEKAIEKAIERGEYVDAGKEEFQRIAAILEARKKDAILHIRVNSHDLNSIKAKAQKLGIKYQTFISEVLHRIAM